MSDQCLVAIDPTVFAIWVDKLYKYFTATAAGKSLATANCKTFPCLELLIYMDQQG